MFFVLRSVVLRLQLTGNGFAKAGLRNPKTSLNTNRAKTIFVFSKLQKNKKRNGFLRLIMTKLSTQEKFIPAFAKPMLADVSFNLFWLKSLSRKLTSFLPAFCRIQNIFHVLHYFLILTKKLNFYDLVYYKYLPYRDHHSKDLLS